jgi:hypothetical protein
MASTRTARTSRLATTTLVLGFLLQSSICAQALTEPPKSLQELHDLTDAQTRTYVRAILSAGIPVAHSDELTFLVMNRSELLVPELLAAIKVVVRQKPADDKLLHAMGDIIAYAGDDRAIQALAQLADFDEERFAYFLGRCLTYATGRRNPYGLVYSTLAKVSPTAGERLMKWVEGSASDDGLQRLWALALYERYRGIPTESEMATDPIATRLSAGVPLAVKARLKETEGGRE